MSITRRTITRKDGSTYQQDYYTIKFQWKGQDKSVPTGFKEGQEEEARALETELKDELKAGRIPALLASLRKQLNPVLADLIADYIADDCPYLDFDMERRVDKSLKDEKVKLATILKWWSGKNPDTITVADYDDYVKSRKASVSQVKKGRAKHYTGVRTAEAELQALTNVLNWAVRKRKLEKNPITKVPVYRNPKDVRHARECMPNADQAHQIAAELFKDPRSRVCAWGYLLACYTGLREKEMRLLRTDAQRVGLKGQAGLIDGNYLHVHRCKNGMNPRVRLDDPQRPWIRPLLDMILAWKAEYYPDSPWFLPGMGGRQLRKSTIGAAVSRVAGRLNLGEVSLTTHGARAFYVTTRLAQGHNPETVAKEVGQRSGDQLVKDVYGIDTDVEEVEHYTQLTHLYRWLPNDPTVLPGWTHMTLAAKPFGPVQRAMADNIINLHQQAA